MFPMMLMVSSSARVVCLTEAAKAWEIVMVWSSRPAVAGHVTSVVYRVMRPAKSKPSR